MGWIRRGGRARVRPGVHICAPHMGVAGQPERLGSVLGVWLGGNLMSGQPARTFRTDTGRLVVDALILSKEIPNYASEY